MEKKLAPLGVEFDRLRGRPDQRAKKHISFGVMSRSRITPWIK
jgi:hypothetical protein